MYLNLWGIMFILTISYISNGDKNKCPIQVFSTSHVTEWEKLRVEKTKKK